MLLHRTVKGSPNSCTRSGSSLECMQGKESHSVAGKGDMRMRARPLAIHPLAIYPLALALDGDPCMPCCTLTLACCAFSVHATRHSRDCSKIDKNATDGSLGYYDKDAALFASWNVDYLKFDGCAGPKSSIVAMKESLSKLSRPILYSINNGQRDNKYAHRYT